MKVKLNFVIVFLLFSVLIFTGYNLITKSDNENPLEKYSKVKVYVNSEQDMVLLQMNDITVEEYEGKIGEGIEIIINQDELSRLKNTALR